MDGFFVLTRVFKTRRCLLAFLHSAVGNGDFEFATVNSSFLGTADDNDGVDGDVTSGLGNLRNDNDLDGDVQEKVNPSS